MLDHDALIRILTEPKNAIVKQYQKLLELDGVKLVFDDSALNEIADISLKRKTGARGLRAIMENTMMDIMYRAPSDETLKTCRITGDVVTGKAKPECEHTSVTVSYTHLDVYKRQGLDGEFGFVTPIMMEGDYDTRAKSYEDQILHMIRIED